MWITGNCDVCILRKKISEIVYGERYNHLANAFFHIYLVHSYSVQQTVVVRFISTDDSVKTLSSIGKKRKASQETEDTTEDHAGIFMMNTLVNIM